VTKPGTILVDVPSPFRIAFSTRIGGVSTGAFASLNLGLATDDKDVAVLDNRERLLAALDADVTRAAMCRQVHGATVSRASATGIHEPYEHPERDGLWTDRSMEPVVVLSADCVPVALCRPGTRPAIAAVHAGWRGLLAGVLEATVDALESTALVASIGSAIGRCCYDVSRDLAGQFSARFGRDVTRKSQLDLALSARRALEQAGVRTIQNVDLCTACNPKLFFSHRRDAGVTGRQGLVAFIEEATAT